MCTGHPRSRETPVSCADRQRPAALPLPAWEQREPEQPHQESPAHHHQVQWKQHALSLEHVTHTLHFPYVEPFCTLYTEQICFNRPFSGVFFFFLAPTTRNTLTLSITGLLDSLKNKSEPRIYESPFPSLQSRQNLPRPVVHLSHKQYCTRYCWWCYRILIALSPIHNLLISW